MGRDPTFLMDPDERKQGARIKIIGIGGAGGNAINRMIEAGLSGVEFIAVNTDLQALENSHAPYKVQIGTTVTRGLGAGAVPELGRQAIEEDRDRLEEHLTDVDMVFVTAGMGGGTGTGAAPVIAEMAKEMGALTIAVVTKPFIFEGRKRMGNAEEGIAQLREGVDTLIVIPNQRLLAVATKTTTLKEAFRMADDVLLKATRGISDLIMVPGLINLDFNDVRTVMLGMGDAMMGTGSGSGEDRAVQAAQEAIKSPLLEDISIAGAQGVLINISGGEDLSLFEVSDATTVVNEEVGDDANIIFGAVIDEALGDEVRVTVIATGFNARASQKVSYQETEQPKILDFSEPPKRRRVDVPTYTHRPRTKEEPFVVEKGRIHSLRPDDLDFPAYLRKRMETSG